MSLKFLVNIIQLLFVHVCCNFCVVFFHIVLKAFHSLQQILMLSVCKSFSQTLKILCSRSGQLLLIHYLVNFLCLIINYLSVSKVRCLLLLLLLLIISSISVVLGSFWILSNIFPSLHLNSSAL